MGIGKRQSTYTKTIISPQVVEEKHKLDGGEDAPEEHDTGG
jgi:hypothetical protein